SGTHTERPAAVQGRYSGRGLMRKPLRMLGRGAAGLPLVVALGGCAALNPFHCFGGSDEARKPVPLTEISQSLQVRTLWQARVGSSKGFTLAPAVRSEERRVGRL